jgi:hypothetical protein
MKRSVALVLLLVLAIGGCSGGGHHHHGCFCGSLLVSWSYDLIDVAAAVTTFGPCTTGLSDFRIELYDSFGLLIDFVVVNQPFDLFDIQVIGFLEGEVFFVDLLPGDYEVRFVSGQALSDDLELYCFPDTVLFSLDLPESYFVGIAEGHQSQVLDQYTAVFTGVI